MRKKGELNCLWHCLCVLCDLSSFILSSDIVWKKHPCLGQLPRFMMGKLSCMLTYELLFLIYTRLVLQLVKCHTRHFTNKLWEGVPANTEFMIQTDKIKCEGKQMSPLCCTRGKWSPESFFQGHADLVRDACIESPPPKSWNNTLVIRQAFLLQYCISSSN